jgi:hypothetical protein
VYEEYILRQCANSPISFRERERERERRKREREKKEE